MLNSPFKSAEEFKELFGYRTTADGRKVRKNKILLTYYMSRDIYRLGSRQPEFHEPTNMQALKDLWMGVLQRKHCGVYTLDLMGYSLRSNSMRTDRHLGLCVDGDMEQVRYVRDSDDREFKMRPGKLLKRVIEENPIARMLPEPVVNWLCEEFAREWAAFAKANMYTLVVDRDFRAIYEPYGFGSCMSGQGQWDFYLDAVDASAASLRDGNGDVVARCVIFNDVYTERGDHFRYAERQYVRGGREELKTMLVDKLKEAGLIDCHKAVGAGCHDSRAIVNCAGESMADLRLYIDCRLAPGDTLSYQDTFKYFNEREQCACNRYFDGAIGLDETDPTYRESEWDDYNEIYTRDAVDAYYDGCRLRVDANHLDDFAYVNGEYYHLDYCGRCARCGDYFLLEDAVHSELTGDEYCCHYCCNRDEDEYRENYMFYSDVTQEWYECESERAEAEAEYKAAHWLYSALLDDYFRSERGLELAENEYKVAHWHWCSFDSQWHKSRAELVILLYEADGRVCSMLVPRSYLGELIPCVREHGVYFAEELHARSLPERRKNLARFYSAGIYAPFLDLVE